MNESNTWKVQSEIANHSNQLLYMELDDMNEVELLNRWLDLRNPVSL